MKEGLSLFFMIDLISMQSEQIEIGEIEMLSESILVAKGEGDIPLQALFDLLQKKGYGGYYTLDWEKVWWPDVEEPEISFRKYVEYMKKLAYN